MARPNAPSYTSDPRPVVNVFFVRSGTSERFSFRLQSSAQLKGGSGGAGVVAVVVLYARSIYDTAHISLAVNVSAKRTENNLPHRGTVPRV